MSALAELRSKVATGTFERARQWGKVAAPGVRALLHRVGGPAQPHPPSELLLDVLAADTTSPRRRTSTCTVPTARSSARTKSQIPRFGSLVPRGARPARGDRRFGGARAPSPSTSSRRRRCAQRLRGPARAGGRRDQHAVLDGVLRRRRELHVRPLDREARSAPFFGTMKPISWLLSRVPSDRRAMAQLAPARSRGANRAPDRGDQPRPHPGVRRRSAFYTPDEPSRCSSGASSCPAAAPSRPLRER